ncbi:MAG: hypothetical protein JWN08_408 [Frankiales bacterium]|nr:hypothetical protein [Frankiales bacterium]
MRQAAGGGRWVSTSPERLQRWLDGFAARHGPVERTAGPDVVRLVAEDGAVAELEVPFGPLVDGLVEHALRDRTVGVLLVRLGGCACGVFQGPRLVASKVTTRQVHGRIAAGGQSQQRFARRREGQVRVMLSAAADTAVRVLLPAAATLDAVVVGGERTAVDAVLADPRLAPLRPLVTGRLLDGPDPRQAVLDASYDQLRAVWIRVVDP